MGQKGSSFLKRFIHKSKKIHKTKPAERISRRKTIEQFLRKRGFIHDGETLIFVDIPPTDERNQAINEECHTKEYISHLEHVCIVKEDLVAQKR